MYWACAGLKICCQQRQAMQCPLFTERHAHHSSVWTIPGFSMPQLCLACATERLEDRSGVPLHCRRVLSEFQALLTTNCNSLVCAFSSDKRVLDHFSSVVFGLLVAQDVTISQPAMEVLGALANQFSTTELPRRLMQKTIQVVMAAQNFSTSFPYLTFLGRLLHSLPPLCREITHSFGGFLEYLLSGLAYPEESVKSAVAYILVQLSMKTPQNSLSTSLIQTVCRFVSSNLASAKSHDLTLNLLGLVKGILKSSAYAQCLLQTDRLTSEAKGSTLASAFKRVLLSSDETLQLSGVQCVAEVLSHHPQYGQALLQADIAEFMFEALTSQKELLMVSLFSCLNSLADVSDFYSKGHIIYGLLVAQDVTISQPAMEVLGALANQFSTTELPRRLMQKTIQVVMAAQNFSTSFPYLTFLGRLLHSLPPLCREITHSFGGFLEYLLSGLAYPEESVKSAVAYILVQLSMKTPQNSLPTSLIQTVCRFVSSNLASAKSHDLTLNLLGLVKGILKSSAYAQCLLQTDRLTSEAKGSTLASAFKRVLLSSDETLQLSGVQCVAEVLSHHPQYGQALLQADIAEFMFEALTSQKELLMVSLFSCLNSLADVSDFYSKGHIIYGIDQVISGLSTALSLKNYSAVQLGLTFLSNVLPRQPAMMPLFTATTAEALHKLLSVLHTALQTPVQAVALGATTTLSCLLQTTHLPAGFPVSSLLPVLSHLVHLLELHALPPDNENTGPSSSSSSSGPPLSSAQSVQLLTAVLSVMENMNKICIEVGQASSGKMLNVSEDFTTFLSISFKENILPIVLMNIEMLNHCEPWSAVFNIAKMQLDLQESLAPTLALRLATLGFIHFAFDIKRKFNSTSGGTALCCSINECVECLCLHLEPDSQRKNYIQDTLHSALPDINCELERSLEFLVQRAPSVALSSTQAGSSSNLPQLQRAVLALFYLTLSEHESITPAQVILQALNRFLVLNPDIHLMPVASLAHLTALYASSVYDITSKQGSSHSATEGCQILVRALLRLPSPGSVCAPSPRLLQWAFAQPQLHSVARTWFSEWLQCLCVSNRAADDDAVDATASQDSWSAVVQFIQMTPNTLDVLLDSSSSGELSASTLSLVDHLLSEVALPRCLDAQRVFSYLQKALLTQRVQPLSETATASVLKLLAKAARWYSDGPDLKLVYHAINFITRCHSEAVLNGLKFLCEVTSDSKEVNSQVLVLLHNNASFIERLISLVPSSPLPKDHSAVSASAIQLIGSLIHHQHKTALSVHFSCSDKVVSLHSTLATLIHPSPAVQVSGLYFWRTVLSTGGYTGCFVLGCPNKEVSDSPLDVPTLKKLAFLIQNCLVKDGNAVREAAVLCLNELLKYRAAVKQEIAVVNMWTKVTIDHLTTLCVNSHIPPYYLSCLQTILSQLGDTAVHSDQLRDIAQLLYKSLATEQQESVELALPQYTSCFKEIQKIDRNLLDANQWTHLNKIITIQ